jgi:hypothetical protein
MRQEASLGAVWNPSASQFRRIFAILILCEAGAVTPILPSSSHWLHGLDESRFGSVRVRGIGSHFQRRIWTEPTLLSSLMPGEPWGRNQYASSGFGIANCNTLDVHYITGLQQDHWMQEKFVWIIHDLDPIPSSASRWDSSHRPQPLPVKMSPDDDDTDGHFGFCIVTGWKRRERGNAGRECRHACSAEDAGTGRSSVSSAQVRSDKQSWAEPSTIATWRAAILRTCVHHAHVRRTGPCSDSVEPKPGGQHHVIGDTLRTTRLLCV